MLYRIICRFQNTEMAQAAARRIREKISDVFEIRLKYRSDIERTDRAMTNVVYAQSGSGTFPVRTFADNSIFYTNSFNDMIPDSEMSFECLLSVLVKEDFVENISRIMVNEGGYDLNKFEENFF